MGAEMSKLEIRVWDVGHGLSVWVNTPNGQNHWIDAGYNPDGDFSPSLHVKENYPQCGSIDLFVLSHPDKDHFDDLDRLIDCLGRPTVYLGNRSLPDVIKYDSGLFDYQKALRVLETDYTSSVEWANDPMNPECNGGVKVLHGKLDWEVAGNINDSSIVMFYQYSDTLVILPGDIEPAGWRSLWPTIEPIIAPLINSSTFRILIAPHHGRGSGYCQEMFDVLKPSFCIISDEHGRAATDRRFRENPTGIKFDGGQITKFYSTKSNARAKIVIGPNGLEALLNDE
jgi:beta-lactamase superfamily II metal-dependent hydrolase